jgi:hypothetical protein
MDCIIAEEEYSLWLEGEDKIRLRGQLRRLKMCQAGGIVYFVLKEMSSRMVEGDRDEYPRMSLGPGR